MKSQSETTITFRVATEDDLRAIVHMLADDPLGRERDRDEDPLPKSYVKAFKAITEDPNHALVVAVEAGTVAGVLQLTFIPQLTYRGSWRAQVEGVRVSSGHRRRGLGRALLEEAVSRARARGCHLVQLTTDKARVDARRFHEELGFVASHDGMKLHLSGPD